MSKTHAAPQIHNERNEEAMIEVVPLTHVYIDGSFECPRCHALISPDDNSSIALDCGEDFADIQCLSCHIEIRLKVVDEMEAA